MYYKKSYQSFDFISIQVMMKNGAKVFVTSFLNFLNHLCHWLKVRAGKAA